MKAQSAINLYGGEQIRLEKNLDELMTQLQPMIATGNPGLAAEFTRLTGHGTTKRVFVPIGQITHIEEL